MERLATEISATHVGAEMDPSHLFWQGIDPVAAIRHLGDLVYHAAAKDTRINERNCRVYGVLDDRFARIPAGENPVGLGGKNTLTRWPPTRRGISSRSGAATTRTSGLGSARRWPRSIRRWP
jgi:sugar phosphate isomerase/epimerase